MNVYPHDVVARSSGAPLPSPPTTGEGKNERPTVGSGHPQRSHRGGSSGGGTSSASSSAAAAAMDDDDGDLRKLSGGTALSEGGPGLKEALMMGGGAAKAEDRSLMIHKETTTHNPSGEKTTTSDGPKKRRSRKKWKKPKDKPNRPLSAYNLFFQAERAAMLGDDIKATATADHPPPEKGQKRIHRKTHGKIGFADMARNIGQKWKDLPDDEKKPFMELATKEKDRYVRELEAWKAEQALIKPTKSLLATLKAEAAEIDSRRNVQELESAIRKTNANKGADLESMTDELHFQKMALLKKQQQQQQIEEDYYRVIQERRMAFLAGRVGMESSLYQHYPSAAEASANALLSQYQPGSLGGMNSMGFAMGPMGMNSRGMNNMGMNNLGMNNLGLNNMGLNNMGMNNMNMNNMGMNSMGMNSMGMNNMGMNMGTAMSRNALTAASMNIMNPPPDLQQQFVGAGRFQQQLRAGLVVGQALNETPSSSAMNTSLASGSSAAAADMSRIDELSSQLRKKSMNGRLSF